MFKTRLGTAIQHNRAGPNGTLKRRAANISYDGIKFVCTSLNSSTIYVFIVFHQR